MNADLKAIPDICQRLRSLGMTTPHNWPNADADKLQAIHAALTLAATQEAGAVAWRVDWNGSIEDGPATNSALLYKLPDARWYPTDAVITPLYAAPAYVGKWHRRALELGYDGVSELIAFALPCIVNSGGDERPYPPAPQGQPSAMVGGESNGLRELSDGMDILLRSRQQCDEDGQMISVSQQALEELANMLYAAETKMDFTSRLTGPVEGQGGAVSEWRELPAAVLETMRELGNFVPTSNASNREVKGYTLDAEGEAGKTYYRAAGLRQISGHLCIVADWLDARAALEAR